MRDQPLDAAASVADDNGWVVVSVHGAFDGSSKRLVEDDVAAAAAEAAGHHRGLVVDTSEAQFLDSEAFVALLSTLRRFQMPADRLRLVCDKSYRRAVLEQMGVDRLAGVYATREDAVAD